MSQLIIRQGPTDFDAFKIGCACLGVGGTIVSVTVNPLMIYNHLHGQQEPVANGPLTWIVWMTFADTFDPNVLDHAIDAQYPQEKPA
jgi:hypothetical protein